MTPTSPLTNCGAAGQDCIGSPNCSGFAFADPADATAPQACVADGSEAPIPAQPAD